MPVTMPRTVTVVPLHAAFEPSVWIFVIGVVPSAPGRTGRAGRPRCRRRRTSSGVGACGPVKSATLSSVSCVPPALRMNAVVGRRRRAGNGSPAPSR